MARRSVALLIETSNEYARGLLRGVLRYQQEHERWAIDLPEQHRGAEPPSWVRRYPGDGVIARVETAAVARAVRAAGVPVVDVSAARRLPDVPWVETDDDAIAAAAVDHFAGRGLRHLAFCGESRFNWSRWRRDAFAKHAAGRGLTADSFEVTSWPGDRRRLTRWLHRLPEPCGLMAAYDSLARRAIDLCREAGRGVPESVAVVGVDDDPLLCRLAEPSLTSIIPDAEGAGYVAAEQLDRLMAGHAVPASGTLLPPRGVSVRRSTDTLAADDPAIAAAARFILDRACDGVRVADVVAACGLSRRSLEARFKAATGKTPHAAIVDARLARAEQLLRETTLTLDVVARRCGVERAEYLNTLFRKRHGVTPGRFRTRHR